MGKDVFHLVDFGTDGKIAFRQDQATSPCWDVQEAAAMHRGMGACLSAHFVSRVLRQLGHEPRIIPAIYVKPFVKGQKNDYNDAEAIAEAALRPNLRTVREKSQDQLDLQACHRVPRATKRLTASNPAAGLGRVKDLRRDGIDAEEDRRHQRGGDGERPSSPISACTDRRICDSHHVSNQPSQMREAASQ
ncbi:hypothetical protein AB8B02_18650 [Tardiphaga sp. 862_B3_N4_1]|uniref:hypothetical protein n=1 Tax=unclassified Tardiphaga TaxID=2631404 RepID=UPI003F234F4F